MADEQDPLSMLDEVEGASPAPSPFSGTSDSPDGAQTAGRFAGMGPLLEEQDAAKVVNGVTKFVTDTKRARARRRAEWERNRFWVKGIRGVELRRINEDKDDVELHVPLGAYDIPPVMDRCDELLEKRVSHLTSDPAVPEAEPASESDEDIDSAEFTTRLLTVEGSESGFNNQMLVRRSLRKASIYGSGFVYPCVDPTGGGWKPMECRATEQAKTLADAGKIVDPTTKEIRDANDDELTTRYVMPDKTLTDDPSQADRQWLPKIRPEILTGEHVVLIPETCTGIADADGVCLIRPTTWGRLVASFPELASLKEDEKRAICEWRPEDSAKTSPRHAGDRPISNSDGDTVPDTASVIPLVLYMKSQGAYPKGAYIVCVGKDKVLHKDFHLGMVEGKTPADLIEECLELPFAQFRDCDDDVDDDPYGKGTAAKLGPADELRGDIILAWTDYVERFNRPQTYLPLGSIVQPGDLQRRDGNAILFNPQGKPEYENIPGFPPDGKEFLDRLSSSQDSASALEETGQGVDSPNSVSGVAKQTVIQQVHVNLTTTRANTADGQERLWRIIAQLYRVYWTIPQKLKVVGDDGAYKYEEFDRTDLGSTRSIKIARGSFTQQSPEEKQLALDTRKQQGLTSAEEYERLSASNLSARLGMQDSPHRLRARRQLSAWKKGPKMGDEAFAQMVAQFEQETKAYQALVAQTQSAQIPPPPIAGMPPAPPVPPPAPLPPPPVDPTLEFNPFKDQLPVDAEQDVALQRHGEFRAHIASTSFTRKHPKWKGFLLAEYAKAKQEAGVMTVAEQHAAQQPQQAPVDPNSPAGQWQKVVQTVTNQAIAKAEQVAALMVESADGIGKPGGPGGVGGPGGPPAPAPEPPAPTTPSPDTVATNDVDLKKHAMQLAHDKELHAAKLHADHAHALTSDSAQRAHDAEQADADRAAELNAIALKAQGADIPSKTPSPST